MDHYATYAVQIQLNAQVIVQQMNADHGLCQGHIVSTHILCLLTLPDIVE